MVLGSHPIHDFAYFDPEPPSLPLHALIEGYKDHKMFHDRFQKRLLLHKLDLHMGELAHYVRGDMKPEAELLTKRLRKTLGNIRHEVLLHRLRLIPILPNFQLNADRYIQVCHTLHDALGKVFGAFKFFDGHLEDELVMHLQDHARLQVLLLDGMLQADHGYFDQVGVRTLDGHVDGFTFDGLAFNGG